MLPSEKYTEVIRLTRLCARICGADVADKYYKVNFITFLVAFCITVYFIFSVYTVHLKLHESWGILLEAFCMVGSVFQGISKLLSGIMYKKIICENSIFLTSLYVTYEVKGKQYTEVLNKCVSRVQAVLKGVACLYAVVISLLIAVPLVMWVFTGRRLFVMQFYMPLLDPDTTFGYFTTIGMQSTCLIFGGFGNFAGDMFMLVFFAHFSLFVDILKLKTMELNEWSADLQNPNVMEMLLDVLKWHQTYSNFTEESDMCFFWINFTQVTTSGLSIVLTLFIMFTGNWPGSYAYLCLSFAMLYLYCGMGTIVEVANEDVINEIYGIHWYNMTISQQKTVGFMLMKSQSPKEITVGGVVSLSVSTGLQVTKTVYSVFMMLLNFFS